MIISIPFN